MQARHKLAIKEHLEKSEFDLTLFDFNSEDRFTITLVNTDIKFQVKQDPKNFNAFLMYQTQYTPEYPLVGPLGNGTPINKVLGQIDHWIKTTVSPYLEELELSEKWNSFESRDFFDGAFSSQANDLTKLTSEEVRFLESAVSRIKEDIRNEFEPTKELAIEIDKKLDYLIESTDRLNRFDLKGTILNTFLSIGVNLGVDTESGKELFRIFSEAFNSIPILYETAKTFLAAKFGG